MVKWAQTPNQIILTICLEDVKNPKIEIDSENLHFVGLGGPERKTHEVTINLYSQVDPKVTIFFRNYFFLILVSYRLFQRK